VICTGGEKSASGVWLETLKEKERLEDLGVDTHQGTKYQTRQREHSWRKITLQMYFFFKGKI
jgi:hypothetical protein